MLSHKPAFTNFSSRERDGVFSVCYFCMIELCTEVFGSFGLSTKEPYTIMNCASALASVHTSSPGTGLDIETSYLVHIRTYVPIYAHEIFSDSDL